MKLYFTDLPISGDIAPDTAGAYDLGTVAKPFRDLYLTPDSVKFVNTGNLGSVAATLSQASFEGKIDGTGLTHYIAVFTGGDSLTTGHFVITQDNKVGILQTSPSHELDVAGAISGDVGYFNKLYITGTNRAVLQLTGGGAGR